MKTYELIYTINGKEHVAEGVMELHDTWSDIVNETIDSANRAYPYSDVAFIAFKEHDDQGIPLDPDDRDWEYDGFGKKRNKRTGK